MEIWIIEIMTKEKITLIQTDNIKNAITFHTNFILSYDGKVSQHKKNPAHYKTVK